MAFDNIVQISETAEYPECFNAVTIEGTGDEGGLESFVKIKLTVSPSKVTANGSNAFTCRAEVFDPTNPTAIECQDISEEISATDQWYVSVGSLIKSLTGVWYSQGNEVKGDEITHLVKSAKYGQSIIKFSEALEFPLLIVEYKGNEGVTFDTSNPHLEFENRDDPDWELPQIDGEFDPKDPVMVDGTYDPTKADANNYASVTATFTPAYDQNGLGYITAKWKNNYATVQIYAEGGAASFDISIEADPTSIPTYSHSKVQVKVTRSGEAVTGKTVTFSIWKNGNKGYLSPSSASLEVEESVEEITTSKDFETMLSYLNVANPIVSITQILCKDVDVTAYATVDTDDRTKIWFDPAFGFEEVICEVTYDFGGVATTYFYSKGKATTDVVTEVDDPVIVRGQCEGRDKVCKISITPGSEKTGLSITPDPSSLPLRTGDLPPHGETMPPDNGESYLTIALETPEGTAANGATVSLQITSPVKGAGRVYPEKVITKSKTDTETATPSDVRHVSVKHPISKVNSVTQMGDAQEVASFNGKEIIFKNALTHLLEDCEIDYEWGGFAGAYFEPAKDFTGNVSISATYSDYTPAKCTVTVNDTPELPWQIDIEAEYTTISVNGGKTKITAKVYTSEKSDEEPLPGQPEPDPIITPIANADVTFWLSNPVGKQVGVFGTGTSVVVRTDANGVATTTYYAKGGKVGSEVVVATTQQSPVMDDIDAYLTITVESPDISTGKYSWKFLMGQCSGDVISLDDLEYARLGMYDYYNFTTINHFHDNMIHIREDSLHVDMVNVGIIDECDYYLTTNDDPLQYPVIICLSTWFAPMPYISLEWEAEVEGGEKTLWVMDSAGTTFESKNTPEEPNKSLELKDYVATHGSVNCYMQGCELYFAVYMNYEKNKNEHSVPVVVMNGSKPVEGVKVTLDRTFNNITYSAGSATTGSDGIATFKDLPKGTYKVWMEKDGYLLNCAPTTYTATTKWDNDPHNDFIYVPGHGERLFQLLRTEIQCKLYCTVHTDDIYTDTGYGGKGFEFIGSA